MNKDHAIGFGIGLLGGAVIGGAFALLFAPATGKDTRHLINNKSNEVVNTTKEKTSEIVDAVKESILEASRKGQSAVQALKN